MVLPLHANIPIFIRVGSSSTSKSWSPYDPKGVGMPENIKKLPLFLIWLVLHLFILAIEILSYGRDPQKSASHFRLRGIVQDTETNRFPHAILLVLLRALGV